jgi:ankyrin repeat protein
MNINSQDKNGQTHLNLAASKGRVKLVKALLDNGRDINLGLKDGKKRTALDLSVKENHVEVIDMLKAANGHAPEKVNGSA